MPEVVVDAVAVLPRGWLCDANLRATLGALVGGHLLPAGDAKRCRKSPRHSSGSHLRQSTALGS